MKKKSVNDTFLTETSLFLLQVLLYSMKYGLEFCFLVVKIYIYYFGLVDLSMKVVIGTTAMKTCLKKQCCC